MCLPWAGAGAVPFRSWAPVIGDHASVYGARLPGREARFREPPSTSMAAVVDELVESIRTLPEHRITLFGQCSGAIVAFEVARALRHLAVPSLELLVVASQVAPRSLSRSPLTDRDSRSYLPDELRGNAELTDLLAPIVEADTQLLARYVYPAGDPLDIPIAAIRGEHDPMTSAELSTWSDETTAEFRSSSVANADQLISGEAWLRLPEQVLHSMESIGGLVLQECRQSGHRRIQEHVNGA